MPLTNFPNGITSMGVPLPSTSIPTTFGNYWFVDGTNGSDGNPGTMTAPLKTIEQAYSYATTNNDDVICIRGTSASYNLTSMLTVAKNRVHFVGLDGAWRPYGQGVKINLTALTGASNIATMLVTGIRNSFTNIKFTNASTVTEGIYCVVEGGEYTQYTNCEFYKSTDLDQTGAAEFVWNGDSTVMDNCTVGSLADAIAGSSIRRPCILLTKNLASASAVCRDGLIRNTRLWRQTKDTTNVFIYSANASDVERTLTLEHVGFINNPAGANDPAVCIALAATLTTGSIVLDPTCYASNVTKIATATGVLVTGPAPNSGAGIATNAA